MKKYFLVAIHSTFVLMLFFSAQAQQQNQAQKVESAKTVLNGKTTSSKTPAPKALTQEKLAPKEAASKALEPKMPAFKAPAQEEPTPETPAQEEPTPEVPTPETSAQEEPMPEAPAQEETAPEVPTQEEPVVPAQTLPAKKAEMFKESLLDTIDIEEGGNWLKKRAALEQAFKINGKINDLAIKINNTRMNFLKMRNDVDKQFDVFIAQIGFSLGDLNRVITDILSAIEKERKEEGDLNAEERQFLADAEEQKKELEQIRKNITLIQDRDKRIGNIIISAEEQILRAEGYRKKAWANLESIKQVLNDEKAEKLLADTEALYETMLDIYTTYLQGSLYKDLSETTQVMKKQIKTIESAVDSLKEVGIDLDKKVQMLEDQEEEQKRLSLEEEIDELEETVAKQKKAAKKGWFSSIMSIPKYIGTKIGHFFSYIFSFFGFGQQSTQEKTANGVDNNQSS